MQPELRFDRWFLPLSVPFGLGPRHYGFGRWLVNGSVKGLVKLRIDPAAPARVWTRSVAVSEL